MDNGQLKIKAIWFTCNNLSKTRLSAGFCREMLET